MRRGYLGSLLWETYGVSLKIAAEPWIDQTQIMKNLPPGNSHDSLRSPWVRYLLAGQPDDIALVRNGRCIYRSRSLTLVLEALRADAAWSVAVSSVRHTFIHAGAVEIGGVGLLLPGPSGAGKSTLVAQLVASGAGYLSDEYGVIDEFGRLRAFPCRARLKGSIASEVGSDLLYECVSQVRQPLSVAALIFPRYMSGSRFETTTLSRGTAALRLLTNVPAARLHPQRALVVCRKVADHALCGAWVYPEGRTAADVILNRFMDGI